MKQETTHNRSRRVMSVCFVLQVDTNDMYYDDAKIFLCLDYRMKMENIEIKK